MLTTKEKAADLLEQGDGTIPKESTDMSTVALSTIDLPVEERGTISFDRRSPITTEELAFAKNEGTRHLETRYVLRAAPRQKSFSTPGGKSFRSAGSLYVRTCRDGVRRFVAYVHEDSIDHDFRYLDRVINEARSGRMAGWERSTFGAGDEGWVFNYPNYQIDDLEECKQAYVIVEESPDSSDIVGFGSAWGHPCCEPLCREKYHEDDDAGHTLDSISNQVSDRGGYEIEICKDMTQPGSDWYVNFWANGDLTELAPSQIASLANDLHWMSIACSKVNQTESSQ